jgi:hypothetical protein
LHSSNSNGGRIEARKKEKFNVFSKNIIFIPHFRTGKIPVIYKNDFNKIKESFPQTPKIDW